MSLKLTPQIFKWLQSISLVKEAKRNNEFLQLSEQASIKFFDGNQIGLILKSCFSQLLDQESLKKIESIKENSNPAIRLYNWNILGQILRKIRGVGFDSSEKSKILNLQSQALAKVLKSLYESKLKESQMQKKGLKVQITEIHKKSLLQASNSMQFLIMILSKNFKLSPQHTLNLFLDNNKYLSHLLVKGVKNSYNSIYEFLQQIKNNLQFLVTQLFCIDEQENTLFFLNALKPCFISKDQATIQQCTDLWMELVDMYKIKGLSFKFIKSWVKNEGLNTLFFTLTNNSQFFLKIIELCYACLQNDIFQAFQFSQKSLLWSNDKDKLSFFRRLVTIEKKQIIFKFIESQYLEEWLKHLIKSSKRAKQLDQFYEINIIFQSLWLIMEEKFEDERLSLAYYYIQFLKLCLGNKILVNFISTSISLFNLIKVLGDRKNIYAPQLFKLAVNTFSSISSSDEEKITFYCQNLVYTLKEIKNLPGGSLVSVIIKHLSQAVNSSLFELCKVLLLEGRLKEEESVQILEILTKIIFQDTYHSGIALQIVFECISGMNDQVADAYLLNNSKLSLSNFVSQAKNLNKNFKELKAQLQAEIKSIQQGQNLKAKQNMTKQFKRFLSLYNSIQFLHKYLDMNDINLKSSLQSILFHTYVKVKIVLKKKKVADFLIPLMKFYYENQDQLQFQVQLFQTEQFQGQDSISNNTLLKSSNRRRSLDLSSIQTTEFKTIDPSILKPSEFALKDLQALKKKRDHLKTIELQNQKKSFQNELRIKQIKNLMNQKRLIEFGSSGKADFQYQSIYDYDMMKEDEHICGVPSIRLVNFQKEQQITFQEDLKNIMKKYRKVWRFLFFKYTTFGAKKQQFKIQEKINMGEIWKMLRQYEVFPFLKKQESQMIIKIINDNMKRKTDPQTLTYLGFQEYIIQVCTYAFSKSLYSHIPPGRQVLLFIEQLKKSTKQKGGSVELFQNTEDVYFQQTDVIRQYNRRLRQNPDYILPEGYKKYKQQSFDFQYNIHPMLQRNIKESFIQVYEILNQIMYEKLGVSLMEPVSIKGQVTLAKPALFQNLNEKMKEYKRGYLQPKSTIQVSDQKSLQLRKSIVLKKQFKPHIKFSLGIKLGLSSISVKNKTIAQQVAYWMHDMLNAIQNQSLKVQNTAKKKVENVIIKKRRVQSLEKLRKQKSQNKQWRKRAQSVKMRLQLQKKLKQQQNSKKRQIQIQQMRKKRARDQEMLRKKLIRFEEIKKIMEEKRQQQKYKKLEEEDKKKEKLQEYREKVEQYFQKKREEILQQQKEIKERKKEEQILQQEKKEKQQKFKTELYLSNLKKQEQVLEKVQELKQTYEELWQSDQIKEEFKKYQTQLRYLFNLLLKYQKTKMSATDFDEVSINTLHFFALKFMINPFMVEKTDLIKIFNFILKQKEKRIQKENQEIQRQEFSLYPNKIKSAGLNFQNFQQSLLLIAVKAKKLLNEIKEKRKKKIDQIIQMIKQKGVDNVKNDDIEELSEQQSQQENSQEEDDEDNQKSPGLVNEYLYDVQGVTEETLRQIFIFLRLPKEKLSLEERYRQAIESKNSKPKKLLKADLKRQMQKVKLEDIGQEEINNQEKQQDEG